MHMIVPTLGQAIAEKSSTYWFLFKPSLISVALFLISSLKLLENCSSIQTLLPSLHHFQQTHVWIFVLCYRFGTIVPLELCACLSNMLFPCRNVGIRKLVHTLCFSVTLKVTYFLLLQILQLFCFPREGVLMSFCICMISAPMQAKVAWLEMSISEIQLSRKDDHNLYHFKHFEIFLSKSIIFRVKF